ncbi:MAG TPA: UDP-3-O-(3-hydroxymyristoyl)glucosamine N-acyltransferase [Pyrinomonadaceae bacterium]|nr:UDP-3-O-(3-hydroxymyristoyl)glucosamine N-acyltransferase [Pyrinomonadaceae bacterium]
MNRESAGRTVAELAALVGARARGDAEQVVRRVASIEGAGEGDVVFVEDEKLLASALGCGASCAIVPEGSSTSRAAEFAGARVRSFIEAARPKLTFALVAEALHPPKRRGPAVHPTAVVAATARLGADVFVGPYAQVGERAEVGDRTQILGGAHVGDDVRLGADCVLHPSVVLYDGVTVGARVTLHAGVVLGADGFGYVRDPEGVYHKFPQVGTVVVEDDVELGAHTCVDRGALGETRVGRGTKIDNLVQIAHNVQIGERVVIAAQTGISGSTVVESDAVIGGQVGMGDHARVQSGAVVGSQAGILPGKIVRPGVWWGTPVQPLDDYKRLNAHVNALPRMRDELKELRRQLAELRKTRSGETRGGEE